jgi:hypothetical protein
VGPVDVGALALRQPGGGLEQWSATKLSPTIGLEPTEHQIADLTDDPGMVLAKHEKNGEMYLKTEFFKKA